MGWGGFGSNGSVHWQISYDDKGPAAHVDFDDTKKHPGSRTRKDPIGHSEHPGQFRITARYANRANAEAALKQALARLQAGSTASVELDVDVRPYQQVKSDPGSPENWEIIVRW